MTPPTCNDDTITFCFQVFNSFMQTIHTYLFLTLALHPNQPLTITDIINYIGRQSRGTKIYKDRSVRNALEAYIIADYVQCRPIAKGTTTRKVRHYQYTAKGKVIGNGVLEFCRHLYAHRDQLNPCTDSHTN